MKNVIIRTLGVLFVLPGFVFDVCLGCAFILNDGRADKHSGDFLAEWAFAQFNTVPDYMHIPFFVSVVVGLLPAGIFCIAGILCTVVLCVYILNGVIGSVLSILFTGKIQWITLTSWTDI